jgi:hypothetical protein
MPPKKLITVKKKIQGNKIENKIKNKLISKKTKQSQKIKQNQKTKQSQKINIQSPTESYLESQHRYNKYYPSILEPNFGYKISKHNIFKNYKLKHDTNKLKALYEEFKENKLTKNQPNKLGKSNVYILKPTQKLLRNFMSPYTPYRSLLIFHEMGVGKTCTAISIAENLKDIVLKSNTKIYVIRPDEIERQIFNINMVKDGTPDKQCTGSTYIENSKYDDLVKKCSNKDSESCNQLKSKVDKDIKKIYEFYGAQMWATSINKELELKTKNIENQKEKENKESSIIRNQFNNAVIIIDEAHEMRESGKAKTVPPVLMKVLKYASNLRLIFLSATPIYDKPQNIVSMINYFLLNDKRPIMKESDIFDGDGELKATGKRILENNIIGYVSYLRGNNPYEFPIRLSARYNIPEQMLELKKYPSYDINGKKLDKDDKIKYLDLIDCPFEGEHLKFMNYYIKNQEQDLQNPARKEVFRKNFTKTQSNSSTNSESNDSNDENDDEGDAIEDDIDSDDYADIPLNVAYIKERQISNFIYQSLEEANNNVNLVSGKAGLRSVAIKKQGKQTYEFKTPLYGKRFMLPELKNWGIKIAKVLERAIESTGPIFVYSFFNDAGVLPLAFALEMNGFTRYKQQSTPLLENPYKNTKVARGEYIIYTGDASLSQFAKEYLDKRENMIKEKNVKVFIGSSKASEGLNLFGYREVHILDPWHNINLIEQSIGRVIRTGSHIHLPPQDRNVSVYQYATTLNNKESYDLKMYKMSENKAVRAGIIEKMLKESAFDCYLNKEDNTYSTEDYDKIIDLNTSNNKKIKVSLADKPFSRNCFYMKDCNFKCAGESETGQIDTSDSGNTSDSSIQIMKFNIDKDIEELQNLIKQLMKTSFNIKINNLKLYLKKVINNALENTPDNTEVIVPGNTLDDALGKSLSKSLSKSLTQKTITIKNKKLTLKTKKNKKETNTPLNNTVLNSNIKNDDIFEEVFSRAIQSFINENISITDKFNRVGNIVISGDTLRFIPLNNLKPNISIQTQELKPLDKIGTLISGVDLKTYINQLGDKQKKLVSEEEYNYDEIINKNIIEKSEQIYYGTFQREYKYNIKVQFTSILEFVFYRLPYLYKNIVIKTILGKIINGIKLSVSESKIEPMLAPHIIYLKDIFPNTVNKKSIYGYIIQNTDHLELFIYNENNKIFEINNGNIKKVIEFKYSILDKTPKNKLYGFLKYEKNNEVVFKYIDIVEKGEKKSVKGITCRSPSTTIIKSNLNKLEPKLIKQIEYNTKFALCNDFELLLQRNDNVKLNNKKWFYTPEEYYIYFDYYSQ